MKRKLSGFEFSSKKISQCQSKRKERCHFKFKDMTWYACVTFFQSLLCLCRFPSLAFYHHIWSNKILSQTQLRQRWINLIECVGNILCFMYLPWTGEGCMTNFNSRHSIILNLLRSRVSVTSCDRDETHTISFCIWRFAKECITANRPVRAAL